MEAAGWARPVPATRSTALARQMQSVKQLLLLPFLAMDSVFFRNVQLKVYQVKVLEVFSFVPMETSS